MPMAGQIVAMKISTTPGKGINMECCKQLIGNKCYALPDFGC